MRRIRDVAMMMIATFATTSSALATSRSAFQRSFITYAPPFATACPTQKRHKNLTRPGVASSGGLGMIFGNFFGGGAAESAIDYDSLKHPGPEMATAAEEGRVLEKSLRDPNLCAATFAGGCFWGLELAYQRVPGVVHTAVGYTQGGDSFPTYSSVCSGGTGHTEAVCVYYDPGECTYNDLLDRFFERVDPTTVNGQGNDYGTQYRTGVYWHTKEQEDAARTRFSKEQEKYKGSIATELKKAMPFWPAEKYHQQYLVKGGQFGIPQSAEKGATDTIRCYG